MPPKIQGKSNDKNSYKITITDGEEDSSYEQHSSDDSTKDSKDSNPNNTPTKAIQTKTVSYVSRSSDIQPEEGDEYEGYESELESGKKSLRVAHTPTASSKKEIKPDKNIKRAKEEMRMQQEKKVNRELNVLGISDETRDKFYDLLNMLGLIVDEKPDYPKFFKQGFTANDIALLVQLLFPSYYGIGLQLVNRLDLLEKFLLLITVDKNGLDTKPKSPPVRWLDKLSYWMKNRVVPGTIPHSEALFFQHDDDIQAANVVSGAAKGIVFITKILKVFAAISMIYDLSKYSQGGWYGVSFSNVVWGTPNKQQSLLQFFSRVPQLPIFITVWGSYIIGQSLVNYIRGRVKPDDALDEYKGYFAFLNRKTHSQLVTECTKYMDSYESALKNQIPLSKFSTTDANTVRLILWDGRISAEERFRLYRGLEGMLKKSNLFDALDISTDLSLLALGMSYPDMIRSHEHGLKDEIALRLLQIQVRAYGKLIAIAKEEDRDTENLTVIERKILALNAHNLLWEAGHPHSKKLQPVFLLKKVISMYLGLKVFITGILALHNIARLAAEKADCLSDPSNIWGYISAFGEETCSKCGDLPVNTGAMFDFMKCIPAYLAQPRPAVDVANFFHRVNWDGITMLDLSHQNVTGDFLPIVLPALPSNILQLYLNGSYSVLDMEYTQLISCNVNLPGFNPLNPIGAYEAGIIANYLQNSNLQILDLSCRAMDDNAVQILASGVRRLLNLTIVNSDFYSFGDMAAMALANNLHSAKRLVLAYNSIGDAGLRAVGKALNETLVNLEWLNMGHQLVTVSTNGFEGWANALTSGSHLQRLELGQLDYGYNPSPATDNLLAVVQTIHNTTLRFLNLRNLYTDTYYFLQSLAVGLSGSSIGTLLLGNTYLSGGPVFDSFMQALVNTPTLTSLDLQGINMGGNPLRNVKNIRSLKTLWLDSATATSADLKVFIEQGLTNSTIQKLGLGYLNNFEVTVAQALAVALPSTQLQQLNCANLRNFDDASAIALAQGAQNSQLQVLRFSLCKIGDSGFAELMKIASLKELQLSDSLIGKSSINMPFSQGLQHLQILNVGSTVFNDQQMQAFAQAAITLAQQGTASVLQTLYMPYLNISGVGLAAFAGALSSLSNLKYLSIGGGNRLNDDTFAPFITALPGTSIESLYIPPMTFITDKTAQLLATTVINTPIPPEQQLTDLDDDDKGTLIRATPTTNLNTLTLDLSLTTTGVKALCQTSAPAGIERIIFNLPDTIANTDPNIVDTATCAVFSVGFHLQPPLMLKLISSVLGVGFTFASEILGMGTSSLKFLGASTAGFIIAKSDHATSVTQENLTSGIFFNLICYTMLFLMFKFSELLDEPINEAANAVVNNLCATEVEEQPKKRNEKSKAIINSKWMRFNPNNNNEIADNAILGQLIAVTNKPLRQLSCRLG